MVAWKWCSRESPGSVMLPRALLHLNLFIPCAMDCMSAQPNTQSGFGRCNYDNEGLLIFSLWLLLV